MASAPTPSPNCSSVPPRPNNTNNQQQHHNKNNHKRNLSENSHSRTQQHQRQNKRWSSTRNSSKPASPEAQAEAAGAGAGSRVGAGSGAPFAGSGSGNAPSANSSSLGTLLGPMESRLSSEFSGRRSTRYTAAKMHSGRPRISPNNHRHSEAAVEVLNCLINAGNNPATIDTVLDTHVPKLWKCDDFVYLLKEFGNTGHFLQAHMCYEFAMCRENGDLAKGKLTSAMIGTLGRLGKVENAWNLFQVARHAGFGNTVYSYSAMISAFGRNGCFTHAVNLFRSMPSWGLEPNLIVYNALIDAGAKGEVDFDVVVKYFDELVAKGLVPDRVTYNSLLCTCAPKGLWELAQSLLREMDETGVGRDLYSYNTYLDTLCKAGKMDLAKEVLEEMPRKKVWPSVVTYSTMMDGYAKANRLEDALNLYDEMNCRNVGFDRVSYNTLIGIYAKLGWFEEAIYKCREMERRGIRMDVVTYNALLGGYGKQGKYDEVRRMFEEMKARNVYPNMLTYSTMIDVFTKSGRYREAMDVYREFKQEGLEVDVVFYSALIDALCKNGLVESSMMLLDAMIAEGIKPNVVTYNSIIDAFGQLSALECAVDTSLQANEYPTEHSSSMVIAGTNQVTDKEGDRIMNMFEQLVAAEKSGHMKNTKRRSQDQLGILWIFRKMHEMDIKPNVVTFSAILNACSRCNSFEGTSRLLDELRVFDNQAYGVAHGLLIGYRDQIWFRALSLFDEVKRMDSSTASAFYNALTDMLWHFGQKLGAQMVVLEGRRRNVWKGDWSDSCLDLHLMSCGAACAMVHAWLLYIRSTVFEGCELPRIVNILTGWGKHSKVVGDGTLKRAIEALLNGMGSPFRIVESNLGRFTSPGDLVAAWLRQPSTWNVLVLHDLICHSKPPGPSRDYPALCL